MISLGREVKGSILAVVCVPIFGLFPVVVKYGVATLNPIVFGSYAALVCAVFLFVVLFVMRAPFSLLKNAQIQLRLFVIGAFGTFLSSVFFFIGSTMTTGINAAILLQIEPVYSMFIGYIFLRERIRAKQIYATLLVIFGTLLVLYNGRLSINIGDIFVLLTPLCWQVSHYNGKILMRNANVGPIMVSFGRTLYGGLFLFVLALIMYRHGAFTQNIKEFFPLILFQGVVTYAVGFILWYKTLSLINLSKATALITPYPVFSFFMAQFLLKESPTIYQIAGLSVIVVGIYLLLHVKSEVLSSTSA